MFATDSIAGLSRFGVSRAALAIGTFAGVHLGHRKVLRTLLDLSREKQAAPVVMTFDPHPRAVVSPEKAPPLLVSPEEKLRLFAECGMAAAVIVPFSKSFAALPAPEFLERCLTGPTEIVGICVGETWRFGVYGAGDAALLREESVRRGFAFRPVPELRIDGRIVSSTLIRNLIQEGRVREAARYLGRPCVLRGVVERGFGVAHGVLECPTANLTVECGVIPANGVYAARAIMDGERIPAVAAVGSSPTFQSYGQRNLLRVEAHLFTDANPDLYGRSMELELIDWIREERAFPGPEDLKKRIALDVAEAKRILEVS